MADTVRNIMEMMIPELQDLEARGYFTKEEIRQITKRRSDFEYLLKRKAARKADYLRYVDYESQLEELRRARKEKLDIGGKPSLADRALVRRIHFIFERATRKFQGDLRLWLAWLDYCKTSGAARRFSKVVTKALRLLPNEAGLWAYAAAWEFEHNLDAGAARALMQAGLRNCPSSVDLWVDYVRLELAYAHKLQARRRLLGIDEQGADVGIDSAEAAQPDAAMRAVMEGKLALLAWNGAVNALPGSFPLHRKTLNALRASKFSGTASVIDAVYDSLAANFGNVEEAWDLRARRKVTSAPSEEEVEAACALYEEAVQAVPSAEMFQLYSAFLEEGLDEPGEQVGEDGGPEADQEVRRRGGTIKRVLALYRRAHAAGLGAEIYEGWVARARMWGSQGEAMEAAQLGCDALPACSALWQLRLALLVAEHSPNASQPTRERGEEPSASQQSGEGGEEPSTSQPNGEVVGQPNNLQAGREVRLASSTDGRRLVPTLQALLREAGRKLAGDELAPLWQGALDAAYAAHAPLLPLTQQLVLTLQALRKGPLRGGMGEVAGHALRLVCLSGGRTPQRQLLQQLLKCPPPGGSFFQAALQFEAQAPVEERLSDSQITRIFEAGVDAYGNEDEDLWLQYLQFETNRKTGRGMVYWRAVKALASPDSFIARCQQPRS